MKPRILLLAGVVLLLAAVLAYVRLAGDEAPDAATAGTMADGTMPPADDTAANTEPQTDHLAVVLARPLFAADRRPEGEAPVADAGGGSAPRLSGIIYGAAVKRAFFDGPDGKPVGVGEGDTIGDFRVRRIEAMRVLLSGPGGEQAVSVAGDPALSPSGGPAARNQVPTPLPNVPTAGSSMPASGLPPFPPAQVR